MTVLAPNSGAGIVWEIQFSNSQQTQMERLATPSTVCSSTLVCPHCRTWNCQMQLCAEAKIQGASIILKSLNLVRVRIQNSGAVYNNVHGDNFCVLIRVRGENTTNETYWKTAV